MKKKILLISLRGGYGHVSTSNALFDQLKSQYDISVIFLFEDILHNIDFLARLTNNRFSFPKLYNYILQKRLSFFMKALYLVAHLFFSLVRPSIKKSLFTFFNHKNPDCIISVVPLVNSEISEYTKKADIPFILIPTDIDAHFFLERFETVLYEKIRICPMLMNDFVKKQLLQYKIDMRYINHIGAILRADFFAQKNTEAIKKKYKLPENKPILMVMMGGVGSAKIIPIAQKLSKFPIPLHILLCTGQNTSVIEKLNNITWTNSVSHTIIGFTEHIADYMATADLLFTKSGTLSVLEGLYMKKIMLLDGIGTVLPWEQYNHTFIEESKFGYSIKSYEKLESTVLRLLQNPTEYERIQTCVNLFNKKNGTYEIITLLQQFL